MNTRPPHPPYALNATLLITLSVVLGFLSEASAQCAEAISMHISAGEAEARLTLDPNTPMSAQLTPPPLEEPLQAELSPSRYLRALSLDLRGRLPSPQEYARLGEERVSTEMINELLSDPALPRELTRFHQSLLWGKLDNLRLSTNELSPSGRERIYWRRNSSTSYRGGRVSCLEEPARFDAEGNILTTTLEDGTTREGWVWVSPYWAPDEPIKVCAFDAQEATYNAAGQACADEWRDPTCGCGPNLTWCPSVETDREVISSLVTSFEHLMTWVFSEGGSYLDLFESQRLYVNGPIAHFLRHHLSGDMRYAFTPAPVDVSALPQLPFTARDTWVPVTLTRDHAGVLTHPVYLLRFQTNRARADRFFDSFLCSPFTPPDGGVPVADEASVRDPDLQQRAGCKYCHALLEPAAAHWGRWTEQGAAFLPSERFPAERPDCLSCALTGQGCSAECRDHYLTDALTEQERPFLGQLKSYVFRRQEHSVNVERGPRLLVMNEVVRQRLPRCVASRTARWLLGRELTTHDDAWLNALGLRFARSNFNLRSLISEIVRDERYRRVK